MRYKYYHNQIAKTLRFIVEPHRKILFIGSLESNPFPLKTYPKVELVDESFENYKPKDKFDYIVLSGALGKSSDMLQMLKNLQAACHPSTRIIVYQHNHLWQGFLSLLESLGIKKKEGIQNWLSVLDVKAYLEGAGYEVTRIFK